MTLGYYLAIVANAFFQFMCLLYALKRIEHKLDRIEKKVDELKNKPH